MNALSETLLNRATENVTTVGQEQDHDSDIVLVEMGKVSDTKGGWLGYKQDVGAGLTYA